MELKQLKSLPKQMEPAVVLRLCYEGKTSRWQVQRSLTIPGSGKPVHEAINVPNQIIGVMVMQQLAQITANVMVQHFTELATASHAAAAAPRKKKRAKAERHGK